MKVVFSLPYGQKLFDPTAKRDFGGAEVRAYTFARGLAELEGFEVTFLVGTDGETKQSRVGNLSVLFDNGLPGDTPPWLRPLLGDIFVRVNTTRGFPWIAVRGWRHSFLWQLPTAVAFRLWNVIHDKISPPPRVRRHYMGLDADVLCAFGISNESADVVAAAKAKRIPCVIFVASDSDLSEVYLPGSTGNGVFGQSSRLCRYTIKNADHFIVQTELQKQLLKERFNRESTIIKNPMQPGEPRERPASLPSRYVFWVGRSERTQKRPALAIELAKRCPDIQFVMVLNRTDSVESDRIQSIKPPNVMVIEQLSLENIDACYQHASIYLSTSAFEGFPNAFLQAGQYGAPVFSLDVDPDGILDSGRCGFCAHGDLEKLARELQSAWKNPPLELGANFKNYVARNHESHGRIAELAALLNTTQLPPSKSR